MPNIKFLPASLGLAAAVWSIAPAFCADESEYVPPDMAFLAQPFNHCKTGPASGVRLTEKEVCQIDKLKGRCTPADDCLVACLASGQGRQVGGGCWHICFQTKFDLSKWASPTGLSRCETFDTRVSDADDWLKFSNGELRAKWVKEQVAPRAAPILRRCLGKMENPDKTGFMLVADAELPGKLTSVAVRPETNLSRCVAQQFESEKFSLPSKLHTSFPIALDLKESIH